MSTGSVMKVVRVWLVCAVIATTGCSAHRSGTVFKGDRALQTPEQLAVSLESADFIILGERHDNPHHHDTQLAVLKHLHKGGWLKQLSLEMLLPSQQAGADLALEKQITDLDELKATLSWDKGWDWELYGPIVAWAVSVGVPLKAANLDLGELKKIRHSSSRVGEMLLGEKGLNIHRQQFMASHCGHINETGAEIMLRVQVARDARMAASLMSTPTGSVLLAGGWHARKDIGVPRYVLASRPEAKIVTVGMLETHAATGRPLSEMYDAIWLTPGVERPDYCAMFKNGQLKKP